MYDDGDDGGGGDDDDDADDDGDNDDDSDVQDDDAAFTLRAMILFCFTCHLVLSPPTCILFNRQVLDLTFPLHAFVFAVFANTENITPDVFECWWGFRV